MRREMGRSSKGVRGALAALFAFALLSPWSVEAAGAQTRRAFVVGEQRYSDPDIPSLTRSDNDANDVAADLEQVGFDRKNITLATELRGKADFDKRFGAFLATVKEGDIVLFFYSGHGLGVEASNTNYLLLGDIKSLRTYTRGQVIEADRRRDDLISLKMPSFEGAYETDEIAKNGISVTDVMNQIADKKPKVAILLLDACRSIIRATTDEREIKRGLDLRQPPSADEGSALRRDRHLFRLFRRNRDRDVRLRRPPAQLAVHRGSKVGTATAGTDPDRPRPARRPGWSGRLHSRAAASRSPSISPISGSTTISPLWIRSAPRDSS